MTNVLAAARCPQCAALVRPGQPWCTLCHADLRPEPAHASPSPVVGEPAEAIAPQAPQVESTPISAVDPLYAPLELLSAAAAEAVVEGAEEATHAAEESSVSANDDVSGPGSPSAPGSPTISNQDIEAMLAQLAAQTTDPLGGVGGRFTSRSAKVMLAVGVALGATAFLLLAAVVATAVFG